MFIKCGKFQHSCSLLIMNIITFATDFGFYFPYSGKKLKGNAVKIGNSSRCCKLCKCFWPYATLYLKEGEGALNRSKSEDLPKFTFNQDVRDKHSKHFLLCVYLFFLFFSWVAFPLIVGYILRGIPFRICRCWKFHTFTNPLLFFMRM